MFYRITKNIAIETHFAKTSCKCAIPILNIRLTVVPIGQDHPGIYGELEVWKWSFDYQIYSRLHAEG